MFLQRHFLFIIHRKEKKRKNQASLIAFEI
jgi:hypothetical protein